VQIAKDVVALIEYTLKDDSGQTLDTSVGRGPLGYVHGHGNLIPGLEAQLEGKSVGDTFKVSIPPAQAYGERSEEAIHKVWRRQLPPDAEIKVGMQFQAQSEHGTQVVTVIGVDGDRVMLDGNHPLAGMTLHFDVKIVETRAATAEELQHGHVHGAGGHHH